MSGSPALAFLATQRPLDFGRRLARLRWRRATGSTRSVEVSAEELAARAFGSGTWVVLLDDASLPVCSGALPEPGGRVLATWNRPLDGAEPLHTLRELEEAGPVSDAALPEPGSVCALAFDAAAHRPSAAETVGAFLNRLARSDVRVVDARFGALRPPQSFGPRPEVAALVPAGARRLLDVGCRDGAAAAAMKADRPDLVTWGIERDAALGAAASARLDRVLVGDASEMLERLERESERFDAFVFADVIEHLIDPIEALERALSISTPGAALVVSVPNVGHLSVVRDLLAGRFDAVPAGLLDASHLRFFTRRGLEDVLAASGWTLERVAASPGAAPRGAEAFLSWAGARAAADRASLRTYQWLAVARNGGPADGR